MTALMICVLVVFIMVRVRDLEIGGRPCSLCHQRGRHSAHCPARGHW